MEMQERWSMPKDSTYYDNWESEKLAGAYHDLMGNKSEQPRANAILKVLVDRNETHLIKLNEGGEDMPDYETWDDESLYAKYWKIFGEKRTDPYAKRALRLISDVLDERESSTMKVSVLESELPSPQLLQQEGLDADSRAGPVVDIPGSGSSTADRAKEAMRNAEDLIDLKEEGEKISQRYMEKKKLIRDKIRDAGFELLDDDAATKEIMDRTQLTKKGTIKWRY